MRSNDIKRYTKSTKSIEGWFSSSAAYLFGWIDEIQKRHSITGNLFEIGCHHGKSAQLLGRMTDTETERLSVCDLFGQQAGNVSRSGCGDLATFELNMQPVKARGVDYQVFQKNSTQLTKSEIGHDYRFFHVDGGHNPDEALADLRLAAQCLCADGVIVLDDPFRTEWPGVTEALIRFLDEHDDFESLLVGCNKIIITQKCAIDIYASVLENKVEQKKASFGFPWKIKILPFHNSNLRILYIPDYREKKTFGNLIRRMYYSTPLPYRHDKKQSYSALDTDVESKGSTV